jgi:hypothetical protein
MATPPDFAHRAIVLRDDMLRVRWGVGLVCLAYVVVSAIVFFAGNSHGTQAFAWGVISTVAGLLWWLCVGVALWVFCFPGTSQILDMERRVLLHSFTSFAGIRTVAMPFDD